jgi:TonB-linked SusC/RagA family outer membrane protein
MKNFFDLWMPSHSTLKKLIMELKITFLVILVSVSNVLAIPTYSQVARVSLDMKNTKLEQIIDNIESQSEFYFVFNQKQIDVNRVVSIQANNELITNILPELFKGTNVNYIVFDKKILLTTDPLDNSLLAILSETKPQQNQITGVVSDKNGTPLAGVTVLVTGTTLGIVTDATGKYSINIPQGSKSLKFSLVGMETQEISIGTLTQINVTMTESTIGLGEVVVIGYGTSSQAKLVSSVSQIKTDKIEGVPYETIVDALAGRSSGVFMEHNPSASDGGLDRISIRGGGEPLYIIDGIKATKEMFSMIVPEDIDNISILKDASSTAVYGSQAGDGIVLVTTKKGTGEKLSVNYSANVSFQTRIISPSFLNLYQQAVLMNTADDVDGIAHTFSDQMLQTYKDQTNPQYLNTNYYNAVVKKFAPLTKQNLTLSGASGNTTLYLSLNYDTQDGLFNGSTKQGTDRYSIRASVSHKLENIGLTVSGESDWSQFNAIYPAPGSWAVYSWTRTGIGVPLYNPAGNFYQYGDPLAAASDLAGYQHDKRNWINNRISLLWELPWVKGLRISTFGNYLYENDDFKKWNVNANGCAPFYNWDNSIPAGGWGSPNLTQSLTNRSKLDLETHINYSRTFGGHTISFTGVYTQYNQIKDTTAAYRRGFISSSVDEIFAGSTTGQSNFGSEFEEANRAWVGRVSYDYKSKYLLEFSGRYDGSDNFAPNKRWGFFPSISAGWNIADESFMQSINNLLGMKSFKVRASWGVTGLITGANRFGYIPVYNYNNDYYYSGGSWSPSFSEGPLVSPDFTWYKRTSLDGGIDFTIFNGKLSGTADWFYYRTTNFLTSPTGIYSTPLGTALPQILSNSAQRRGGAEFSLNYKTQVAGINITIGGNIAFYNQLWERLASESEATLENPFTRLTQQTDYYTVGYQALGYYQSMNDIYNNPRLIGLTKYIPGQTYYQDINGDGKVDSRDKERIGTSSFPHTTYGLNFDFSYKGFSLDGLFQGAANRQLYLGYVWYASISGQRTYDIQGTQNCWTPTNPNAMWPILSTVVSDNGITSTKYIVNGAYLRLKSLNIGYDFKRILLKNLKTIQEFTLYFSCTNVFTISPLNKYYIDPESPPSLYTDLGFDVTRSFSFGVRMRL